MKKLSTVLISLLLIAGSTYAAGKLEDAEAAYSKGNYAEAAKLLKPLALDGDARAQFRLGMMYQIGTEVIQDDVEAAKWFKLSAAKGYALGQFHLGTMYDFGRGVPKDYVMAVKWYKLAAEQGQGGAQEFLGQMYQFGNGVVKDNVKAYMWFNLAASQKNIRAKENRDKISEIMTSQQIAKAQNLASECLARKYKGC